MKYTQWNYIIIASICLPVIFVSITNYIIDPFDIFHSHFLTKAYQLNERANKIEHLKKHHALYNSYLLGSSRMGTTTPSIIEKYFKEAKFYNLTVAGGTQYDNLQFLEYLIKHRCLIKNLYLQIDITDIYGFSPPASNFSAHHHPEVEGKSYLQFYLEHLTVLPLKNWWGKIKVNTENTFKHMRYDIENSGRWYLDHLDTDPAVDFGIKQSINRSQEGKFIERNIEALKRIKYLADAHGINLIVFIAPHNHHMVDSFNLEGYFNYLRQIANISPYWDFSGYNSITNNDINYYETSHYRTHVAQLIAAKIFNDTKIEVPNDFGHLVTSGNINNHLALLSANITSHDQTDLASL